MRSMGRLVEMMMVVVGEMRCDAMDIRDTTGTLGKLPEGK